MSDTSTQYLLTLLFSFEITTHVLFTSTDGFFDVFDINYSGELN